MPARSDTDTPAVPGGRVSVVVGEEQILIERAVARLSGRAQDGARPASHQVAGAELAPGELTALTTPSLFGGECLVVVRGAQDAGKEVAAELAGLAAAPPPDVTLVITHAGGAKGRALLAELTRHGAHVVECPKVTRMADRIDFVRGEFRAAGRRADESGVRALIDAVGSDLRELASACAQLASDTTGVIGQEAVARYYRGRADASGFTVADRAVEGQLPQALELLRWALAVGVPPVLITSGLAQGIRLLGRVGAAPRGASSATLAAEVGAPPWKIDRVRQQLSGWAPAGVARALAAVAEADAQVKGEGASPGYALETLIRTVVACRTQPARRDDRS